MGYNRYAANKAARKTPRGFTIAIDKKRNDTPYTLESLERMGGYYYMRNSKGQLIRKRFRGWGKENLEPAPKKRKYSKYKKNYKK